MRGRYQLHTGYRDIAQWLDWAFGLETPAGFTGSHTLEPSQISISIRTPTPNPKREDEEAVEIAWGGGEVGAQSGPIVLDDVPDVSSKYRIPDAELVDDLPTPQPSHAPAGTRARARPRSIRSIPRRSSDALAASAVESLFGAHSDAEAAPRDSGLDLRPLRVPRTKPGVAPASAHRVSGPIEKRVQRSPTIGAALVERNQPKQRGWLLGVALLCLAGGGGVLAWYATTHDASPVAAQTKPVAPSIEPGTVKFQTEPGDAQIAIDGSAGTSHVGSPYAVTLPPGPHQIEIRHSGYKSWLTSLDLTSRDTETLRVVLEPLGAAKATSDATLAISTTPSDLEVVLDGQLLASHTPIRTPLKIGPHTIAVRQAGAVVWKQSLDAAAASNYEFSPVLTAERLQARAVARSTAPTPAPAGEMPSVTVEAPPVAPIEPASSLSVPAPMPMPAVPVPVPEPPPPAATIAPVTVPPNAVTKLSGSIPDGLRATKGTPSVAAAKLCIDPTGAVSSVDFISKLDHRLTAELTASLQTWRYQPYRRAGTAVPACFAVTLRLKS